MPFRYPEPKNQYLCMRHQCMIMGDDTGPVENDNEARFSHYLELLADENPGSRWKGAIALGRFGDPRAAEPLINALDDEEDRVRLKVIWALGEIGDPRAIPHLKKLYRNETDDMKGIAGALERINRINSGP